MDENDNAAVATEDTSNTEAPSPDTKQEDKPEVKNNRAVLSDEEQLAVLEGRAKRLKTKLGIKDEPSTPDSSIAEAFLFAAGIKDDDEVELALSTAKKWDMPVKQLLKDEDFSAKLEKLRTSKANELATSGIKGSPGQKSASETPEFYIARGTPPTPAEIPDQKTRASIARQMMASQGSGKKFYNQ